MDWKRYLRHVAFMKSFRPKCPKSTDGQHTMINYESQGIKKCCDCGYSEKIYTKVE